MMADITEEGLPHRFELFHTVDGGAERLSILKLKEGADASDVAQQLFDDAMHDMSTRDNHAQRYTVGLFRTEEQQTPEQQFPFRIQPRIGMNWTGGDTEQPTEKGERAQLMRMQNEGHQIIMKMAESFGGRMAHEVERVSKLNRELEEKLAKRNEDFEDLQDRRLDRELARAEILQRTKFYGDMMQSLLPLVPHIASGVLGKFMGGGGKKLAGENGGKNGHESEAAKAMVPKNAEAASREVVLKELFLNMDDQEKQGLLEALHPMHRMVLFTLMQQAQQITTEFEKAAFDSGMQKFMKSLEGEEVMGIMGALDQANRNRFLLVYQSYGKSEEAAQEGLPDILKDNATPPKPPGDAPSVET